MIGLHSLAFELLEEIISLVCGCYPTAQIFGRQEARALCIMRSVSRLTNAIAEPMFFRHLVIHISSEDPGSRTSRRQMLRDLAKGVSNASSHARVLSIIYLHGFNWDKIKCFDSYLVDLVSAVGSLTNLTTVL
jgi:hypothetical protein